MAAATGGTGHAPPRGSFFVASESDDDEVNADAIDLALEERQLAVSANGGGLEVSPEVAHDGSVAASSAQATQRRRKPKEKKRKKSRGHEDLQEAPGPEDLSTPPGEHRQHGAGVVSSSSMGAAPVVRPVSSGQSLWFAARRAQVDDIKTYLDQSADIAYWMPEKHDEALEYKGWKMRSQAIHAAVLSQDPAPKRDPGDACEYEKSSAVVPSQCPCKFCKGKPPEAPKSKAYDAVSMLLKGGADAKAFATHTWENGTWETPVLHMAASTGDTDIIQLLLYHRADVNTMSRKNGVNFVPPIHDAILFNRADCVKLLLSKSAALRNKHEELCLAAWLGHADVVDFLLDDKSSNGQGDDAGDEAFHALGKWRNKELGGDTKMFWPEDGDAVFGMRTKLEPLAMAVEGRRFPLNRLHIFRKSLTCGEEFVCAFNTVAEENQDAAIALLRDVAEEDETAKTVDPRLRQMMQAAACSENLGKLAVPLFVGLLRKSAGAAGVMLDALTGQPEVKHPEHNPLPRRARLPLRDDLYPLSCEYAKDSDWEWNPKETLQHEMKQWQKGLVEPNRTRLAEFVRNAFELGRIEMTVTVQVVKLRGVVCPKVLSGLAQLADGALFGKLAVHALLKHAWQSMKCIFIMDMVFEGVATLVLSRWIITTFDSVFSSARTSEFASRLAWCLLASQGCLEAIVVVWSFVRHIHQLGVTETCEWLLRIWHRVALSIMTILLAAASQENHWPSDTYMTSMTLGATSFLHWWTLLYKVRAFMLTGKRLLPIIKSFQSVGGMLVILAFLLTSFMHSFWALDRTDADEVRSWEVLTFLLTGDNFMDREFLTDENELGRRVIMTLLGGFGIFIFTACCLNLFIAVLGEMYEHEQEQITYTFLKERACICSFLSLRPEMGLPEKLEQILQRFKDLLPQSAKPLLIGCSSCLMCVALVAAVLWGCMKLEVNSWPAVFILTLWTLFHQATLKYELTKDWNDRYLWFCTDIEDAEEMFSIGQGRERLFPQSRAWKLKEYVAEIKTRVKRQGKQLRIRRHLEEIEHTLTKQGKQLSSLMKVLARRSFWSRKKRPQGCKFRRGNGDAALAGSSEHGTSTSAGSGMRRSARAARRAP